MKTKFKVGDKVRILPSAIDVEVPSEEVGKTGVVKNISKDGTDFLVLMDKPRREGGTRLDWVVNLSQIEQVITPGQQLIFSFMEEE